MKSDVILAHSDYVLEIALRLAADTNRPVVSRSHNVEWDYYSALRVNATRPLRRMYYGLESARLRRTLPRLAASGLLAGVAAMTPADSSRLAAAYHREVATIPPFLLGDGFRKPPSSADVRRRFASKELVFVGAMSNENAAGGVVWFGANVWPLVRAAVADASLVVAGRSPLPEVAEQFRGLEGVRIIANPPQTDYLLDEGTVFINPVLSGSGVNMKIGAPLAAGLPVVTTSVGSRGFEACPAVIVARDPREMASRIANLLTDPDEYEQAALVASRYASDALDPMVAGQALSHMLEQATLELP